MSINFNFCDVHFSKTGGDFCLHKRILTYILSYANSQSKIPIHLSIPLNIELKEAPINFRVTSLEFLSLAKFSGE